MLRDILEEMLAGETGVAVVGSARAGTDQEAMLTAVRPDVLMVSAEEGGTTADAVALLCRWPGMQVVTLASDARSATIQRLRLETSQVEEVTLESLLSALRETGGGGN